MGEKTPGPREQRLRELREEKFERMQAARLKIKRERVKPTLKVVKRSRSR